MFLHYGCFVIFFISCVLFYIGSILDSPGQDMQVNVVMMILKVASIVFLQISLAVVLLSLIRQAAKQSG
jgi:hypothetical protein